jgi:hypothetical protein
MLLICSKTGDATPGALPHAIDASLTAHLSLFVHYESHRE